MAWEFQFRPADRARELIAELALARRLEATTEELICTIHAHPTMHEAALAAGCP